MSATLTTLILVNSFQCRRTLRYEKDGCSGVKIGASQITTGKLVPPGDSGSKTGGSGAKIGAFGVKTSALVPPSKVFFHQVDPWGLL